ncbi:hypothetical protein GH714_008543 [Hevea brasiliensis]|uniref:Cytochrome P450 n=1 Tax=Hevea brasiliensis TaxID=3981 RepID=A0A6A6LRS8_HEVBR|nr:hypothetical protein GH714_008543 [Hevea brasiliensis]
MEVSLPMRIMSSLFLVGLVCFIIHLYRTILLRSQRMKRKLRMQGIKGPSPSFLYGNLSEMQEIQSRAMKAENHGDIVAHDYTSSIFPYFEHWRKQYAFVCERPRDGEGNEPVSQFGLWEAYLYDQKTWTMLGNGIIRSNGQVWAQQRKIIAPEFFMDKAKGMVELMVESAQPLLRKWEQYIEALGGSQAEIRVDEDLRGLSADVIARACFGSSYLKGNEIFSKLRTLQTLITKQSILFGITSFGFFASKNHKMKKSLETEIDSLIWETVKEREKQCLDKRNTDKDLMQQLLEEALNNSNSSNSNFSPKRFIIDNCKNIYFAGHEATSTAATWCMMLLALYPDWQSQALRLYPPGAFVSREALEQVQIGKITVPKGVCIWTLIPTLHRDPNLWGPDANEFRPERFADGVSKACKFAQAYIPFGVGTRLCVGRNFAMVELKVVLSLIVSQFTFSLSPNYQHSPAFRMIVEPEHGVQILIRKV